MVVVCPKLDDSYINRYRLILQKIYTEEDEEYEEEEEEREEREKRKANKKTTNNNKKKPPDRASDTDSGSDLPGGWGVQPSQ